MGAFRCQLRVEELIGTEQTMASQRLKVLVLARSYPNNMMRQFGPWVARLMQHLADRCDLRVIAPVPYCPPGLGLWEYGRFRAVERQRMEGRVRVYHPRFLVGPGYSLYNIEAAAYHLGVRRLVDRIHREFPFDVIHAHFGYPDGVVGARLATRYGVPIVVTEHALWRPWMDQYPFVRKQAVAAARTYSCHVGVSTAVRGSIVHFTKNSEGVRVIPNGVDGSVFKPLSKPSEKKPDQLLYVGVLNFNKGLDTLLRAVQALVVDRPMVKLVLVGGFFYRNTQHQAELIQRMANELGLDNHVEFVGMKTASEVSRYMAESSVLVLPSRRESFGSVLAEALACGTPVVATRCGGPEDIVNDQVGRLVPIADVEALTVAITDILDHSQRFDPDQLRAYALGRFAWERVAAQNFDMYTDAVSRVGTVTRPVSNPADAGNVVAKEYTRL